MAFATGQLNDPQKVGAGERLGTGGLVLDATVFEDGLKVGRFAKLDTGSLDNMDGSATPTLAGVVLRNVANAVEDGATIDSALFSQVVFIREGVVTVDVKSGETPARFGRVYVSNAGDASDGLATATNTDVAVNAEFLYEVQSGVWAIYLTPAPADISAHTGDASGAHAASAISLLDAGGFTNAAQVEAALAELYPAVSRIAAIADPGDAGAIPVLRSGNCALTSAGAETRTLAAAASVGITLDITHDVDGGAVVITSATAINQTGNNTITLTEVADYIRLVSAQVGGAVVWRVAANDGAALSTV
jgi:hypothetical protein